MVVSRLETALLSRQVWRRPGIYIVSGGGKMAMLGDEQLRL